MTKAKYVDLHHIVTVKMKKMYLDDTAQQTTRLAHLHPCLSGNIVYYLAFLSYLTIYWY